MRYILHENSIHGECLSGIRFTEEVFKVKEVQETKPHTYLLEDLNGEEIKGSFYSFELILVANKK